ncbi:low-density lipoprotein receptor-related protein 1B-like [Littorina saxatilis]|uniref:low-density lipoprotein receptor-related protein 1B-like n=1 Tax=Littorina saxatilis TaxID=31220 RepID=UPI0038B65E81
MAQCGNVAWKCANNKCIRESSRCDGRSDGWDNCGDNSDEQNCPNNQISQCDSDGKVDLDETSSAYLTCTGITDDTVTWFINYNNGVDYYNFMGSCTWYGRGCGYIALYVVNRGSFNTSTLTVKGNNRGTIAGTVKCGSARCKVRVVYKADRLSNCMASINFTALNRKDWTVKASCDVEKMYASDGNYTCHWIVTNGNGIETQENGSLSTESFMANTTAYVRGTCSTRNLPMPTVAGTYTYDVIVNPGIARLTGPSLEIECPTDEWRCSNNHCIWKNWRCDGEDHCGDGSDEQNCECPTNKWRCGNNHCIFKDWRCDGEDQCGDGSDEQNCECPTNKWRCGNNHCIWKDWRCDGEIHCYDGSDELNCASWTCSPTWWKCGNNKCIWNVDRCDGVNDCADGSDEDNCEQWTCPSNRWKCSPDNTRCLWISGRCDGKYNCRDLSEEENCVSCVHGAWKCSNDTKCVTSSQRCDGNTDCGDGSDEHNCECPTNKWRCGNDNCIWKDWRCDGEDHCGDGSDEQNCANWTCSPTWWKCGNNKCIWNADRCDGVTHCADGSDEDNCEQWTCPSNRWKCRDNTLCIYGRCDGKYDCRDRSDEENCECPTNKWRCGNDNCIWKDWRCDGEDHCGDGSDEQNCANWTCSPTWWKCGNNKCIWNADRCDGVTHCADGSDEDNCEQWTCPSNRWKCRDNTLCIYGRCDGKYDCRDRSDEENCDYQISQCGSDGKVDLDETCLAYLTCTGIRDNRVTWDINRDDGTNLIMGSCSWHDRRCVYDSPPYEVKRTNYSNSTLIVTCEHGKQNNRNSIAGTVICRGNHNTFSARCKVRVVYKADRLSNCTASINLAAPDRKDWTVKASCDVEKMYASDGNYSCYWIVTNGNGTETQKKGSLSTESFVANTTAYVRGTCWTRNLPMPTVAGTYNYDVIVNPGNTRLTGTRLEIK